MKNEPAANPRMVREEQMGPGAPADISRKKRRAVAGWAVAIAFLLYGLILFCLIGVYGCGGDSWDYFCCAKVLDQGCPKAKQRVIAGAHLSKLDPLTFVPGGFFASGDNQMVPEYSTGLPLAMVAFSRIAGWHLGPRLVMLVSSLLGILVTYWLGREWGLTGFWAGVGALILAINPLYLYHSFVIMSDVPALVCVAAAVLMAHRSRSRGIWALAAGCAVAAGVLVRPTNILVMAPVAVCLGFSWRRWLWLVLGGLPGAVFLYLYTTYTYGRPFESSYGGEISYFQFGMKSVPALLLQYLWWMPIMMTPLVVFVLGLPWLARRAPGRALTLIAWIAVFFGFYAMFSGARGSWSYNRYVLPAFPACLAGALWVLQSLIQTASDAKSPSKVARLLQGRPRPCLRAVAGIAAAAWLIYNLYDKRHTRDFYRHYLMPAMPAFLLLSYISVKELLRNGFTRNHPMLCRTLLVLFVCAFLVQWNTRLATFSIEGEYKRNDPEACQWAQKNLPRNAVIYSRRLSAALYYCTDFTIVRWDAIANAGEQQEIERACATNPAKPIYALFRTTEINYLRQNPPYQNWNKNWTLFAQVNSFTCWRLNDQPAR